MKSAIILVSTWSSPFLCQNDSYNSQTFGEKTSRERPFAALRMTGLLYPADVSRETSHRSTRSMFHVKHQHALEDTHDGPNN
jgi:hypothetical protein